MNYTSNWGYHVNLLHVLFVAPLLLYIGYKKSNIEYIYFDVLTILGYGLLISFGKKALLYYNK